MHTDKDDTRNCTLSPSLSHTHLHHLSTAFAMYIYMYTCNLYINTLTLICNIHLLYTCNTCNM